jgi:peptide/nickel transport system substrate-binding protein
MKLRPGMVYSNNPPVNGREVTAEDYVATQDYELAEPKAFDKTFVKSFLDKATATDKNTITMKLKRPSAYLFGGQMLGSGSGQPIVPKETIGPQLDTALQIGSGPYLADPNNRALVHYLYKQSPTYWGRKQGYDPIAEIEATYILDKSAQEAAFYGGQLDYFVPSPEQMKTAKSRMPDAFFSELPGFYSTNVSFNMWEDKALPWQKDARVREAIWHLTDRDEIAKRGYTGAAVPTVGLVPMSLKPYIPDAKDVSQYTAQDPQKAKQLLDAAGFDYSKTYRIGTRAQGDVLESIALIMQTNLAKAGMKTQLQAYGSAFFDILGKKDWDFIVETPPGNDTPGQQIRTQHSDSWSPIYTGFALFDKTLDSMIEKSEEITDYEANRKAVIDIQKYAMSHFSGSMEVVTHFQLFILGPKVQNYELTFVPNAMRHNMWLKS